MREITLICKNARITTTCLGLSQHHHDSYVIHSLATDGKDWMEALPENHGKIMVYSATGTNLLDYVTADPLP